MNLPGEFLPVNRKGIRMACIFGQIYRADPFNFASIQVLAHPGRNIPVILPMDEQDRQYDLRRHPEPVRPR